MKSKSASEPGAWVADWECVGHEKLKKNYLIMITNKHSLAKQNPGYRAYINMHIHTSNILSHVHTSTHTNLHTHTPYTHTHKHTQKRTHTYTQTRTYIHIPESKR
jgi:hypothetical protein